jgi:hypothetical protein
LFGAKGFDDLQRIARSAADIGFSLYRSRGIHIGNDGRIRMALAHQPHVLRPDGIGERTAGRTIRDQHGLFGVQELGGLRHEMYAGEHDRAGIDLGGFAREQEAVADDVGNTVEDFGRLVIVRQHHRVALTLERENGVDVLGEGRPLKWWNNPLDPLIKRRGTSQNFGVEIGHLYSP